MIGGLLKSTTSRLAIVAAAGMFIGGLTLTPAQAADLGGDCCADLEERVADLEATTARKGNRKVSLKISGWVHRSVGWIEDTGGDSEFYSVGNSNTGSRIKFSGSAKLSSDWKAGYVFRFRTGSTIAGINDAGNNPDDAGTAGVAHDLDYVYLSNKGLGTVVLGRAYAPTKSITNISLGGHGVLTNDGGGWNGIMGGFELEQNAARQAVAYISPTVAGFTFAAAWADLNNAAVGDEGVDAIDVALRYANEFGPIRIAAGIGYTTVDNDVNGSVNDGANVMGSVSLLHSPTGLNVGFSGGKEIDGGVAGSDGGSGALVDSQFWHVEGGINQNFFGPGKTSIYGEYAEYDNGTANDMTVWGMGIVQHFDSAATEIYVAYREWEDKDLVAVGNDGDVQQVTAGMRIKF